jgi:Flp pilus assembly protein TadD
MGRTKTIVTSKGVRENASPSKSKKNVPQPLSIPALVNKAQSLMGEMNYELARRFIQRIFEIEPNHVEAREMLGIIEIEEGNVDDARAVRPG